MARPQSPRPPFATAYVGTVKGTLRMPGRVDTWTVQALRFKLQNARFVRGAWGGTYLVTGGRVTFTSKATGECKSTTTGSLSLGRLPWIAAAISFLQNRRDPGYGYQARVAKEHPVKVTQVCADPGGSYKQQDTVSPAGGSWLLTDISERLVPGKRLRGTPHGAIPLRHEQLDVEPCAAPLAAASSSSARARRRSAAAPR